ncbi:sigma 54-interacting transcriptional regulator [Colwellia sp. MB02u-10]|uniref:sigma 54-interacting transcriptional regulator n=1 Tax=Colwellia sp. MB02u-10 TaxID=2759828 RepID=UPI0015F46C69|nr:sigma 54-interacting transcriptional regulator [Colwellia sp. MB02u-10]MBA6342760.1 sigma 54-interacting transcriptional regulator [Colwellia sp. MB02u-10]
MTKLQRIGTLAYVKNSITLYIDSDLAASTVYTKMFLTLQSQASVAGIPLKKMALSSNCDNQSSMLVACQNTEHAEQLIKRFNLNVQQVYWLQEHPQLTAQTQLLKNHWFIDWSNEQALLPILSLLARNNDIYSTQQDSEQKFNLLTKCLGELVVTLSAEGKVTELNPALSVVLGDSSASAIGKNLLSCIKIPSDAAKDRLLNILSDLEPTGAMTRLPPFPIELENTVIIVDGFVGSLRNHDNLLIMRQIAMWQRQEWEEQQKSHNEPVTLLLINPDEFAKFNQQHGSKLADQVLDEIMLSLTDLLRTADFVSRYSGVVFAAHLPETNEKQGQALAARVRQMLVNKSFTQKKLKLDFSFGIATLDAEEQLEEQSPLKLFRRANTALQAARSIDGDKSVGWEPQFDANIIANLDHISGKFSDVPRDDFRLLSLQWDLIRLISTTHSLQVFSKQICQMLTAGMQCEYVGLYLVKNQELILSSCSTSKQNMDVESVQNWVSTKIQLASLNNLRGKPLKPFAESCQAIIVPLFTRNQCLGMILLRWPLSEQNNAEKYSTQLQQVTPNLAAAIDRIVLHENDQRKKVITHSTMGDQHELLFESAAMRTVMQEVQLVAPTDASVLITGESGTGKELIARQIHNHSALIEKPFITVDCSTIVEHLIESELFGHRKGAFTGATSDQPGLIAQADGGTLFLDEVGELPLDIQSKLLRFVQEKTYVAVGDQRVRKVDVRLVLATNRNLLAEVTMGRFRSDLYYRINGFTINLPPLHKRGDDTLLLCRHFLAKFSQQYKKEIIDFTPAAINILQGYSWPGNIRELRNAIMRAVILCERKLIDSPHLDFQQQGDIKASAAHLLLPENEAFTDETKVNMAQFSDISILLSQLVTIALQQARLFPVSAWLELRWLTVCLVKWGSLYQVALQLDQSESTLRRRFTKLNGLDLKLSQLDELAIECDIILGQLLTGNTNTLLWSKIEMTLHQIVIKKEISQQKKAQLLNVTQPTLRKILQQLLIS